MLKTISENNKGDERTYVDNEGDDIVSLYRIILVTHNAGGFDSSVVLISLDKKIRD